jgi:alkanesulfonate monooxygenase SsuD/methylene tetrahydromethanopterin reductase-like flavin-dependent oxidoreductase (luciferase family)
VLGIGIGDNVPEFEDMGIPFPDVRARQQAMDETIAILRHLWSGKSFDYTGKHFSAKGKIPFLPPVQQPYVPILLAGGGEQMTLKKVARYADASNMGAHDWIGSAVTEEDIARKFGKLRGYCEEIGRPFESILRSHFTMPLVLARDEAALEKKLSAMPQHTLEWCADALFAGTPAEAIAFYESLAAIGFQYFIANILDGDEDTIEILGTDVMPAFT